MSEIVLVNVGVDYHDESLRVCVLADDGRELFNRSLANDPGAVRDVVISFGWPRMVVIEACCGAANFAAELIRQTEWNVQLAHPGYVKRMKQGPDKTDMGDAWLLADLGRVNYVPKVWLADETTRQLRRLVRYREGLKAERKNVKLRIRALLRENRLRPVEDMRPWTKVYLVWLKNEAALRDDDRWVMDQHLEMLTTICGKIAEVEKRLRKWTADDAVLQKLLSLDGVGLVTAVTLRAEIGQFDRFASGKQLSRFCGVTPRNASSGQRQADAGLIRAGNPQLRAVLIELGHRLVHRMQGRWSTLAAKLRRAGKKTNVIVAAVANRWVRWLYHQMQPTALLA